MGSVKCSVQTKVAKLIVNRKDQPEHEMNECNFRLARCQVCGENVNYSKRKLHCYVSRREMDEVKELVLNISKEMAKLTRSVGEVKDEMKREMGEMKDQMGEMKDQMGELKDQMGEVKDQMGEVRDQMGEMKDQMGEVRDQMGEMKDQMGEVKDHMGEVKDQMGEVREQMGEMKDQMGEVKREVAAMKKESHRSKQEPESDARSLGACFACFQPSINIREDIIIAGGCDLKSVEMFSCPTRQWTLLPPMTSARWFSSSCVHEGQMFVCGGLWNEDTIETLELKKERGEWKEFQGKLPQETYGHANTIYEENLFIFGGESGAKVVNDIYKVSLVSPYSSQLVSHFPEPRSCHGAQRFGDKVAIVGGTTTGVYIGSLDSVVLYDIKRNCCRTLAPLPFAVSRMATVAWRDNIIIIGGRDKNDNVLNTVVSYNITNETSKMLPSMKHKRSLCSAVVTGNVIVVMGGWDKESGILNSVEIFSFDNYSWEELPPMNEERQGATAVVKSLS